MTAFITVPATFEKNLSLGNGDVGFSLDQALQLDETSISNLYSITDDQFAFSFQEHGVAYNETEATGSSAQAAFTVQPGSSQGFTLKVDLSPVEKWGINFSGRVFVRQGTGDEREIYLPGTRTYDPAGLTGDPHASERIGPACSRTQVAVSLAQLVAAQNGAEIEHLDTIQQNVLPLVKRYHGREFLFHWMKLQIYEAVFKNKDVTPYPEFIKQEIRNGNLTLTDAREHTRAYLNSYNRGHPKPPLQYFQKVSKKDNVSDILSSADLVVFNKILQAGQ